MPKAKPAHQWETRAHRAVRSAEKPVMGFANDGRAEAFTLHFHDGRVGRARLGLSRQIVDAVAESDPDLPHAVQCWLAARGERHLALEAEDPPGRVIARGPFRPRDLSGWERPPLPPSPRTLVTLCPSNAEMVHALGCFDRVVACEDSSDFPAAVTTLERLGPDLGPDLDRIAELGPEAVVSSLSVPGMERVVTGLRARGLPQLVLAPRTVSEVIAELACLADALGVPDAGAAACERMRRELADLEAQLAARSRQPARVYLEWWPKPMYTPGALCYSNELVRLAGGVNVFADRAGSSVEVAMGDLAMRDPEVCFVSWCGVAYEKLDPHHLLAREGLAAVSAVRNGAVFALDERFSGRPGPRMLEAARHMADRIREAERARP